MSFLNILLACGARRSGCQECISRRPLVRTVCSLGRNQTIESGDCLIQLEGLHRSPRYHPRPIKQAGCLIYLFIPQCDWPGRAASWLGPPASQSWALQPWQLSGADVSHAIWSVTMKGSRTRGPSESSGGLWEFGDAGKREFNVLTFRGSGEDKHRVFGFFGRTLCPAKKSIWEIFLTQIITENNEMCKVLKWIRFQQLYILNEFQVQNVRTFYMHWKDWEFQLNTDLEE